MLAAALSHNLVARFNDLYQTSPLPSIAHASLGWADSVEQFLTTKLNFYRFSIPFNMSETVVSDVKHELFFKRLRQETAESHQKLEANKLSQALLSPSVTIAEYQAYIGALWGVTVSCERQIFPALGHIVPDLQVRFKSNLIIADLLATGMPGGTIDEIPVHHFRFSTTAEALGIMYVLEGSTLGGRILYKHIHETLGLTPEAGASYFWGYGPETGNLWKSFISSLTQFVTIEEGSAEIIESAKKTFTIIDDWLSTRYEEKQHNEH